MPPLTLLPAQSVRAVSVVPQRWLRADATRRPLGPRVAVRTRMVPVATRSDGTTTVSCSGAGERMTPAAASVSSACAIARGEPPMFQ